VIRSEPTTLPMGLLSRLGRFLKKPWLTQVRTACLYSRKIIPGLPVPIRLPIGYWWLAWNNHLGYQLLSDGFEEPEYAFVQRFLKEGMVVLDVGANEGYYTLLASKCVGRRGRVISFEPSPRERRRLKMNQWANFCGNVRVEELALGSGDGKLNLHVVEGPETGCNSLRPPDIKGKTRPVQVAVAALDQFLRRNAIPRIDFMKVDVEGAELSVLNGAMVLLRTSPRPFVMIEISDLRTRPWGYHSREIVAFLRNLDYDLFRPLPTLKLEPIEVEDIKDGSDLNVIAVPRERSPEVTSFLVDGETRDCSRSEVLAES
jgi:FkbM family methyltransferase